LKRYLTYALLTVGILGIVAAAWLWWRQSNLPLDHLPTQGATVARIDFRSLRKGGLLALLAAKPGLEEPEYRAFVDGTGFDYQKDLDDAIVSFAPDATYFILRGRFNWAKLETYTKVNGGGCYQELCHLPGSRPDRRISFLPLEHNMMAMAVTNNDMAAAMLRDRIPGRTIETSKDPVWVSIPSSSLKQTASLPAGTRLLASTVSGADRVMMTLAATKGGSYAAHLEAVCVSEKDAKAMTAELQKLTSALKGVVPAASAPDDLTAMLIAGSFQHSDKKVFGYWPIQKKLLENIAGGM
jgi:hypothetical protein